MTRSAFLLELLSNLVLLPAAALCTFPMHHQLRTPLWTYILHTFALFALVLPAVSALTCYLSLGSNTLFFPLVLLLYWVYHAHLKALWAQSLAVYVFVVSLLTLVSNIAFSIEAWFYPERGADDTTLFCTIVQLLLMLLLTGGLYIPLTRYGSALIDNLLIEKVWYATLPISLSFFVMNLGLTPHKYETLYLNNTYRALVVSLAMIFVAMMTLMVMFYFIVMGILGTVQVESQNRFYRMQEKQYELQQQYLESTSKARHDFRHSLSTLHALACAKDYAALQAYLDAAIQAQPQMPVRRFCRNTAVNAVLNHYMDLACEHAITCTWRIDLHRTGHISDVDLCNILGNLLENAIHGCLEIEATERFIQLSVLNPTDEVLCIVCTNSFSGRIRYRDGHYLSTRRKGSGIGLSSIASTAARYSGTAQFHHENKTFYTDILLPLGRP